MLSLDKFDIVLFAKRYFGIAYSRLHPSYTGPCKVKVDAQGLESFIVFPDRYEATRAAKFAVGEKGGYESATLLPAPGEKVTHRTWTSWANSPETLKRI